MTLSNVAAGVRLRASVVNTWLAEINNLSADLPEIVKSGATSRNSSGTGATLTADPHLTLPLLANTTYTFELFLMHNTPAAVDIQFAMAFPSGASCSWGAVRLVSTVAAATGDADLGGYGSATSAVSNVVAGGTGADQLCLIQGSVQVGATPGNLVLYWAQGTSSASNATLGARSWMKARRQR